MNNTTWYEYLEKIENDVIKNQNINSLEKNNILYKALNQALKKAEK